MVWLKVVALVLGSGLRSADRELLHSATMAYSIATAQRDYLSRRPSLLICTYKQNRRLNIRTFLYTTSRSG